MSRKTERLVNLTIALLATKRFLTKSEIFRTIDGYEGAPESKERMFERDKDDLRKLGIEIEVGSFDPLFEDEAGYRIKSESYQFQLRGLSGMDITLLSLAAKAWRGAALDSAALSVLIKLQAMGVASDLESIPELAPALDDGDQNLSLLITSLSSRQAVSFFYRSENLGIDKRSIAPYAVVSKYGHWYLVGQDLDKFEVRSFRLDRMTTEIIKIGKSAAYEIPTDFKAINHLDAPSIKESALLYLRDDRALSIRNRGFATSDAVAPPGWQAFKISFSDEDRFLEEILWFGDDVVVLSPQSMRGKAITLLEAGVKRYG